MLVLTRKVNEAIIIDDTIEIIINEINNDSIKIAVQAPSHVRILRKELIDNIKFSNQQAVAGIDLKKLKETMRKKAMGR